MRKLGLGGGAVLLLVLLAFTSSFAQMEMEKVSKKEIKMMGEEPMSHKMCAKSCGGMMHQMGCCKMGSGMMHQMGCCQMGQGMGMCGGMMGDGEKMGCCQKEFFLCCKDKLELTDKQVQDLEKIKMDFMKGRFKTEADLKIAQLELKSLMDKKDAALKDIEAKMNAAAKLETDMKLSHIKAFRQAKALLTPEQMEKLKKGKGM
jgi:Spy/CpxP family protein refolding chaperone